jgi:heme/copper-type cytochrome/quinol oxidase subunit 2
MRHTGNQRARALQTSLFLFCSLAMTAGSAAAGPARRLTSSFAPESTPAQSIADLPVFVMAITAVIFIIVWMLLIYAIVRMTLQQVAHGSPVRSQSPASVAQKLEAKAVPLRSQPDVQATAEMDEAIGRTPR